MAKLNEAGESIQRKCDPCSDHDQVGWDKEKDREFATKSAQFTRAEFPLKDDGSNMVGDTKSDDKASKEGGKQETACEPEQDGRGWEAVRTAQHDPIPIS